MTLPTRSSLTDGKLEEAWELFDKILEIGLVPTVVTYNVLIDGHCKENKLNNAFEILNRMEKSGCKPNVRTYNELINGL